MAKSVAERRKHKRHRISCPLVIQRTGEKEALKGKTVDISDGGAMLAIPIKIIPRVSERVTVLLAVPRSTANTYMVEEVALEARVVRHQPMENNAVVGVALQFTSVQELGLEA